MILAISCYGCTEPDDGDGDDGDVDDDDDDDDDGARIRLVRSSDELRLKLPAAFTASLGRNCWCLVGLCRVQCCLDFGRVFIRT